MSQTFPREVSLENLSKIAKFYEKDWPKHVSVKSSIDLFIKRFKIFPELREKMKLFVLSDEWEVNGEFFIIFECNEVETVIFFDSPTDSASEVLVKFLRSFDYSKLIDFFCFRNVYRPMLLSLKDELNLKIMDDTNAVCYLLEKEEARNLEFEIPKGFKLRSLTQENVVKVNSLWPHNYENSDQFISYSIKYHLNVGLFNESDNLIAWCLLYDNGSLAVLQVDENHLRKGYGLFIAKVMSRKIVEELNLDVITSIQHKNVKSLNMFKKLGFKEIGPHTWFVFKN